MSRHLGSIQVISWQAGNRFHSSFCFSWIVMRVMQPLKHVYFIHVSARPKKQDIKACFGTPIQTHKEPWYGTQNSSQSDNKFSLA